MQTLATELATYGARSTIIATNLGTCLAASRLSAELERLGLSELDVLVNDAGFGDYADFLQAEPTKLSEMLHLNVVALTELTRVFLPGMVARRRGRVLLVGALSGFTPGPGTAVYNATKAYVLSLGEALARELRGSGVTLTTLCPGPTSSGFCAAAGGMGEASLLPPLEHDEIGRRGTTGLSGDEERPPCRGAGIGQQIPSVLLALRVAANHVCDERGDRLAIW